MWHFRFGKCSIVTARLYAVVAAFLFTIACFGYVYARPNYDLVSDSPRTHHNVERTRISATWTDYLADCGGENVIENSVHTRITWNNKYENNIIEWSGFFAESKTRAKGIFFTTIEHILFVKMDPTESSILADIAVILPQDVYNSNKGMIDGLKKGVWIKFEGAIMSLGSEFKMHSVEALSIQKTGTFKSFADIVVRESALP